MSELLNDTSFIDLPLFVRLQYLLLHPDRIDTVTNRPPRAASATSAATEVEATLPPANEASV